MNVTLAVTALLGVWSGNDPKMTLKWCQNDLYITVLSFDEPFVIYF